MRRPIPPGEITVVSTEIDTSHRLVAAPVEGGTGSGRVDELALLAVALRSFEQRDHLPRPEAGLTGGTGRPRLSANTPRYQAVDVGFGNRRSSALFAWSLRARGVSSEARVLMRPRSSPAGVSLANVSNKPVPRPGTISVTVCTDS